MLCIILLILKFKRFFFYLQKFFNFPQFHFLQKNFNINYLLLHYLNSSKNLVNSKISCYFLHYLRYLNLLVILILIHLYLNYLLLNLYFSPIIVIQYRTRMLNLVIIRFIDLKNFCQKALLLIFSS